MVVGQNEGLDTLIEDNLILLNETSGLLHTKQGSLSR